MTQALTAVRSGRVESHHVRRKAIIYVRQSTPGQIEHNRESTQLQYGLTSRARQLGWAPVDIEVIDDDLGCSAREVGTRRGFKTLVYAVGLNQVGIVISSEVSRLSRNLAEWGNLLELCRHTDTLIADAGSLYSLRRSNDRLLLGIRGTVSEMELDTLRHRMHAAREAKAARGELKMALPRGYVHDRGGRVMFDPDASVRARMAGIFGLFAAQGSLAATLRALAADGQGLPCRVGPGPELGEVVWREVSSGTLYEVLTNPVYAGAFAWGKVRGRAARAGLPLESRWRHLLLDRHPAYIEWAEFEFNQHQLAANRWPVRGLGGGLLSGLLYCGPCGRRMTANYRDGGGGGMSYCCRGRQDYGGPRCQSLTAPGLEDFATAAALNALSPASVALSFEAVRLAQSNRDAAHEAWRLRLAAARRVASDGRRAWRLVDVSNRLVAQSLEDEWEAALVECHRLEAAYRRFCERQPASLSAAERGSVSAAASGITQWWRQGVLSKAEKAEILRLMIERVTVTVIDKSERVAVEVQWQGGVRTKAEIRRSVREVCQLSYFDALRARVVALYAQGYACAKVAATLNAEGWKPARKAVFTAPTVRNLVNRYCEDVPASRRRKSPPPLDRGPGEWLVEEFADKTGVNKSTVYSWLQKQRLQARKIKTPGVGKRRWLIHADEETFSAIRDWNRTSARARSDSGLPDFRVAAKA